MNVSLCEQANETNEWTNKHSLTTASVYLTEKYIYNALSLNLFRFILEEHWRATWIYMKISVSLQMETFLKSILRYAVRNFPYEKLITNATSSSSWSYSRRVKETQQSKRKEPDKLSTELLMPYVHLNRFFLYTHLCIMGLCVLMLALWQWACAEQDQFSCWNETGRNRGNSPHVPEPLLVLIRLHSISSQFQSLCDLSVLNSMSWHSLLLQTTEEKILVVLFQFSLYLSFCCCFFFSLFGVSVSLSRANQLCI